MRLALAAALLIGLAGPVLAQSPAAAPPPPPTPAPDVNLRNFTVRNRAKLAINEANVLLTNKGQESLTAAKGPIQPNEIRSVQTRRDQCPQNITLKFSDGRDLASNALTDCTKANYTVFDDHITAD